MLTVNDLHCSYGTAGIIEGLSLEVGSGEVLAVLGRNGMGKTTLVRSIAGMDPPTVTSGSIRFEDNELTRMESYEIARLGIGLVPQGRHVFGSLTVVENLEVIARAAQNGGEPWTVSRVFEFFPRLGQRRTSYAKTLSGGEQQMLAIGRGLMSCPKLLMLDEPSLGLAPIIVKQVFEIIRRINAKGVTILLVEQNVSHTLQMAQTAYILETGRIRMQGRGYDLLKNPEIKKSYLGV